MKTGNRLTLSTSPLSQPARNSHETVSLTRRQRPLYRRKRQHSTGKERDSETGLYYYGARYLDSRTGRWLSGDPAMGEYVPSAPVNDEARKRNKNLPGQGGVFNYVNLHVYHYAGNNPVKYVDPDGKILETAWDIASIGMGAVSLVSNIKAGNTGAAILDAAGIMVDTFAAMVPFVPGGVGAGIMATRGVARATDLGASVWTLDKFARGKAIERQLGMNLPSNFPIIDKFIGGVATSIKSLDINAPSYQNLSTLQNTLTKHIDSVAGFLKNEPSKTWAGTTINSSQVTGRALELALPSSGNAGQQQVLQQVTEYAKTQGVDLIIRIIQ